MSDQASTIIVLENEEPAHWQVPSEQETPYDDKTFVKQLLDACSNNKEKYNFEDYVVEKGRGLDSEDAHPKTRQKCYINNLKEEALQGFVGKISTVGKPPAAHRLARSQDTLMSNVDLESAKGASSNDDTRGKLSTMLKARIQDLKPFREELQCRKHSSKEKLAEKIPEVIFTGELVHGEGFRGTQLGVACSWHFVWDDPWTLLEGNFRGQTQLAASTDCNAPWNHPLDIHFAARSPLGWPKLVMQVQELDEHGCSHVAGYGFCHLPVTPGSSELTVCCWRPTGSVRDEISAYFLGNTSKLTSYDIISAKAAWANRCRLVTIPTGKVILNLNVILRNFEGNIDMLQHSRAPPV